METNTVWAPSALQKSESNAHKKQIMVTKKIEGNPFSTVTKQRVKGSKNRVIIDTVLLLLPPSL